MTIAVVGAGAAGLMACATILEEHPTCSIYLIEKNPEIGKKVLISGGGRCNVTTGLFDVHDVLSRYPRGSAFLTKAMYHFPPANVMAWFEDHGVPLKIEDDLRVFPVSDNGRDVIGVFDRLFEAHHERIHLLLNTQVKRITRTDGSFTLETSRQTVTADRIILTTGGQAYRHTGSTGDGYTFAESLGHTITPLAASLSALHTLEAWPKTLAGVSFPRVHISTSTETVSAEWSGPLLFTHHGVTGPAVFAFSALIAFEPVSKEHPLAVSLDFFDDQHQDALYADVHAAIRSNEARQIVTALTEFFPKSMALVICAENNLPPDMRCHDVRDAEIHTLAHWMKHAPVHVSARSAGDEFVTAGGVDTQDVDPRTMESRRVPGLFFAGELLNIDGFTGGFNLQASWATGRLAGLHALSDS